MQVRFTHESEFRRERDFGTKVSATFEFLKAQFKPLARCLVYFVLPGALLCGVGLGLFFNTFTRLMPTTGTAHQRTYDETRELSLSVLTGGGVSSLGFVLAFLLLACTVYAFVRVRMDTPPAETVQPAQVWAYIRPRLGRVVLATLLLGVLVLLVIGGALGGFAALVVPATRGGGFGAIAGAFGLFFGLILALLWVSTCLSMFFPVLFIEDADIGTAWQRSFYLVKGKWWSTFGLYMVISFIQSFITYIFAIPMYGIMVVQMLKVPGFDSPVLSIITTSIYAIGAVFTMAIPLIALVFQYFNLVERKDGVGLRLLVDSLGRTPAPQVRNAGYRPDEEGEY